MKVQRNLIRELILKEFDKVTKTVCCLKGLGIGQLPDSPSNFARVARVLKNRQGQVGIKLYIPRPFSKR